MTLDAEVERKVAIDLFNLVWTYLEKLGRTPMEDDTMLHAAHASRYHWGVVGEPVNLARGEWQVSRVYAVLGHTESALFHAQRCLELCQQNNIADFDLAYAYEALARANAVNHNWQAAEHFLALARQAGEDIKEQDDKEWFNKDLSTIPTRNG
jgi:hypothetical protein